jgi:polysaccharide biosynthesis/export protein
MISFRHSLLPPLMACLTLSGCAGIDEADNIEPIATGGGYQAQYRRPDVSRRDAQYLRSATINQQSCLPLRGGAGGTKGNAISALQGERLSRNDLIDIRVGEDETFTGSYVVSRDGTLKLPFLDPVSAQGRSTSQVEADISAQLIAREFYADAPRISVRVADFASVSVGVSGAVFEPHAVEIGGQTGDQVDQARQLALGSSTEGRNLSVALRSVGGVRPDADISAVELIRAGRTYVLDLRGVFEGQNVQDIMLLTGDELRVPSRQCFQDDLMRPSPISPPGVSLYLSNLTQPASGNAVSAVNRDVREVPYGARYMQAVVDSNCVGGPRATSAHRSALLFSRNPITGVSVVIERDIEDMLRRADRDDYDPYLLPGDAIACYDSDVTNIAEIGRVLGIVGAVVVLGK